MAEYPHFLSYWTSDDAYSVYSAYWNNTTLAPTGAPAFAGLADAVDQVKDSLKKVDEPIKVVLVPSTPQWAAPSPPPPQTSIMGAGPVPIVLLTVVAMTSVQQWRRRQRPAKDPP